MENNAKKVTEYTKEQLESLIFKYLYRTSPTHFTRTSPLNFKNTMMIILHLVKKSIKTELMDYFYKTAPDIKVPGRQAFSEAREKISYLAFKDLFERTCEVAIGGEGIKYYKGYRLFAVDGTSFAVGDYEKLAGSFGESTTIQDKAMCRLSAVADIVNGWIVNAIPSPFKTGERALALQQIGELAGVSDALYLFDRGYWSPALVSCIIKNRQKFVMRLASNVHKTMVKDEHGNEINLRRYSFVLPGGETEALITNLSADEMADGDLAALYAKRWGVETKYLELKARLQIDHFSGESANIILQDIYSTMYFSNLTAFMCQASDEIIEEKTAGKSNKYKQKTNRSTCIRTLRTRFYDIFLMENSTLRKAALDKFFLDISSDVTYPGKSKPRPRNKRQIKNSRTYFNKPVL
jgi:hypothetical protein